MLTVLCKLECQFGVLLSPSPRELFILNIENMILPVVLYQCYSLLTFREQLIVRVCNNRVLRRVFGI
jgi:hypothetical protein